MQHQCFISIWASLHQEILQRIQRQMKHMTEQSVLFLTVSYYEEWKRRIKGEKQVFGCRSRLKQPH